MRDDPSPGEAAVEEFADAFERSAAELREAFAALLGAVEGMPGRPLQAARLLGIDKNLAWKVARLARAADAAEAVRHLPGPGGVERVLAAFGRAGAGAAAIGGVRAAVERFDRRV
ncbi:MAG: hypothetical protein L0027_17155, partial [Candidatus Rokubacteria bacterium]|nr:hypothetical protein [Candidatus Rokubacteria bacterium]